MSKKLVLCYKKYDFTNEETGERICGAKVQYLNKRSSMRDNVEGNAIMIISIKGDEMLNKLNGAPAIYDIETYEEADKDNKPVTYVEDFEFVKAVDLAPIFK